MALLARTLNITKYQVLAASFCNTRAQHTYLPIMQCFQVYGFIQNIRTFEQQVIMYSLVWETRINTHFFYDFWIFWGGTNLATLILMLHVQIECPGNGMFLCVFTDYTNTIHMAVLDTFSIFV